MAGVRNLFDPAPDQKFKADGLVDLACRAGGDEKPLRLLLAKLAARTAQRGSWPDVLPSRRPAVPPLTGPAVQPFENPNLPSGYVYLLQLIAHDMIDSEVSLAEAGAGRSGFANTRVEPLSLDTIYGGGPDNTPFAYELDRIYRRWPHSMPRTRLRLGRIAREDGTTLGCPFRDLARAVPIDSEDAGLDAGELLDTAALDATRQPGQRPLRPWRTEALVADVRNDSHALISQLTVLFHLLHNHVLGLLGPPANDPILAYKRFLCARLAVTMIYRSIVVRDVLDRILDPDVYARYTAQGVTLLEDPSKIDADIFDIPLEFTHGAFRFGHALTRDFYRINSGQQRAFGDALDQSSVHGPNTLPVQEIWHADWSLFFPTGPERPNLSVRIGPRIAGPLLHGSRFPATNGELDYPGVGGRDLVSAAYADLWGVPSLMAHIRSLPGWAAIVPDFDVWRQPLRDWLEQGGERFTARELDILSNDPPLPFFVMFEAGHKLAGGTATAAGGGERLGPLGSVIVAETILGALERHRTDYERTGSTLRDHIAAACRDLVGDAAALDVIPDIPDMATLLNFMKSGGAISLPGPA